MPEQSNDYHVIVFGAGGVGKTSLILRFIKGTFVELYTPTIEDTYRQVVNCDTNVCTLQITDTSGSHRFPAMQRLSISRGQAFILVYSITSKQSIEELKPLHEQIKLLKGNDIANVPICLVGNKCDEQDRAITRSEGEALANAWRCAFIETSAKNNIHVTQLFETLLKLEKSHKLTLTDDMTSEKGKDKKRGKLKGNCLIY